MKDEVTLAQALELLMEDQPVHVFDENGDDYFFGYKSAINEEEPVASLSEPQEEVISEETEEETSAADVPVVGEKEKEEAEEE